MTFPRGLLRALVFVVAWPALGLLAAACFRDHDSACPNGIISTDPYTWCFTSMDEVREYGFAFELHSSFDDVESGASTTAPRFKRHCEGEEITRYSDGSFTCPDDCDVCTDYPWSASPVEEFDYRCERWAEGGVCLSWQRVERDPFGDADEEL
jgi:hypothetical protein